MASVIVVENEIKNSVIEYGQIIDSVHQNSQFSDSLKQYFDIRGNITNRNEVATKILDASTSETLSKLSDKEFEPAFYLLAYLLSELEAASFERLLQKDSALLKLLVESTPAQQPSLRDRRSLKPTTIMSILNTFFNFLPSSSPSRIHLVELILTIVKNTQIDFALIQLSIGDNLVGWLNAAGASREETARLFWLFVKLDSAYSEKSLQLIKKFTAQFTLSLEELHDLITFALNSSVVDVSFLVNNNVAAALHENSSDALAQTFIQYTQGNLVSAVPAPLPESVAQKSKILALAKFFVSHPDKKLFSYGDIPSVLVSSPAAFEKLLIDSIKGGVIEGKLNQVDESFYLVRVNRFILAGDEKLAQDWEAVRNALLEWKSSLVNINEIVDNAKENIVNNGAN